MTTPTATFGQRRHNPTDAPASTSSVYPRASTGLPGNVCMYADSPTSTPTATTAASTSGIQPGTRARASSAVR